ncbi:MAG TPA: ATP-binding protein [Candidatus Acidoferrum sp.]|nr:ATP-binding protein [Candidatus Acidoferrum sp.]
MPEKELTRDFSKHKREEETLGESEKLKERLSALNFCGGKLNAADNLNRVYELTLDTIERTLGFEDAAFMIVDKGYLREVCQRGTNAPSTFELPLDGTKRGITVRAAVTRKAILISDLSKDTDYVRGTDRVRPAKSELAVPVIAENSVLGVLNVESAELGAFDEKDTVLLQILASHASTAMCNIMKRSEIERRNKQLALLMSSSADLISSKDLHHQLQLIADAINQIGWRRVVLSVRNEDLEIVRQEDIVTAGLTEKEREFLWTHRQSGQVWNERFGKEYDRFKIGGFFYLPWSDPWVRKRFSQNTVSSHLKLNQMVDWDPEDLLYAPLTVADGRIVGVVSMDDPDDGKRPTFDSLAPLELFLHTAGEVIERAHLMEQLKEYTERLEEKVIERTQELKKTQERLLKSERLATIGELAGMVGHDLRNPLTGIAGATYYLKTKLRTALDESSETMLKVIEEDIQRSNKIINDLLEYSRETKLRANETDPKTILRQTLSSLKVPENITIVDKTQTKPRINVDDEKMRRVFLNLIINAFDAMPKGGTLSVRSRKVKENIDIGFSDTGVGMTNEILTNLWSPLFTTKAKGMGFGLPICKRIIEAHGGMISVESCPNKGSTFTISLPIKPTTEQGLDIIVDIPEHPLSRMEKARVKAEEN